MNTKQLWRSLTYNIFTNPYFDGVYSIDTLKNIKQKPKLIICNTDPSNKPGKHWVLFFFDSKNSVDFYDSLGRDVSYYGPEFVNFIKKFALYLTSSCIRTQSINSSLCGEYCLFYAYKKCKNNYDMEVIIKQMNLESYVLSFVKDKFCCEPYYECSLLQKCLKC